MPSHMAENLYIPGLLVYLNHSDTGTQEICASSLITKLMNLYFCHFRLRLLQQTEPQKIKEVIK